MSLSCSGSSSCPCGECMALARERAEALGLPWDDEPTDARPCPGEPKCQRCNGTGLAMAVRGNVHVPNETMPCPACAMREELAQRASDPLPTCAMVDCWTSLDRNDDGNLCPEHRGGAQRPEPASPDAYRAALVKIAHSPAHESYALACDALGWGREFLPEECRESALPCGHTSDNRLENDGCATCHLHDAIAWRDHELEKLREALALAIRWMGDPSDPLGTFEDIGDWFYRDTGYLRPGKSEPLECGGRDEERAAAWKEWTTRTRDHVQKVCRAALSSDDATVVRPVAKEGA